MINWQNELVFVVFVSEHAAVISLQESDPPPPPPSLSPIPRVVRGSGCHVPGGSTSLSTQIWPIKALCLVCAAFVCWLTCSSHLRCHSAFFVVEESKIASWSQFVLRFILFQYFSPRTPTACTAFPPSHLSPQCLSPLPALHFFFFKNFALHTWVSWHKTPTHPAPPHFSIHKIIFNCRKHFLSERSFREQGRTNK